jgi:parvulin-like peptidyl-prolyl isomerase
MFRRFVVLIAATLAYASAAEIKVVEEIAAKVNGDIVTKSDLDGLRVETENELKQKGATPAQMAQIIEKTMTDALRDKIDELLLVQRGKDLNISVDSDATRELARLQVQSRISDTDKFADWIREQYGVSLEEYKQRTKDKLMAERVVSEEVGSRIFIPEDDMKKYYEAHKDKYVREDQVFLSQILLSTDGKSAEQVASAEVKAKDLVKRARAGEKFTDLAAANSDDPETAKNGGYLGSPLKREDLRPEIAEVAFAHQRGYVTDPIKLTNPSGFLVLKVEERYEAGQATFEEVRDEIQNAMAEPQMGPRVRVLLTKLRKEAFLEIREGYVDSGAAPGQDTTWHDVAEIKPQTTTKEEVASRQKKKFMGLIPYGKAAPYKPPVVPGAASPDQTAKPAPDSQPAPDSPPAQDSQPAPAPSPVLPPAAL